MSTDYIPHPDADLGPFAHTLVTEATGHEPALGILPADLTDLTTALEDWDNNYAAHLTAAAAAAGAATTKNQARAALEAKIRALNTKVQANPNQTPELIRATGLPVHDTTRTRAAEPTTRPLLVIDASQRLQHTVASRDETTPTRRAKPAGVAEIEIWCKIGAPAPQGPGDCTLLATSSKSNVLIAHKDADAGKAAHYLARWKNTRGETGPWSETVVATIGG